MARYGVIADIHGNREALEAALDDLEARGIERFLCAGDIVGYNADPDDCISLLYARRCVTVAGNHDLVSVGALEAAGCSDRAAYALRRTRKILRPASAAWLRALPGTRAIENGIVLTHDAMDPNALRALYPQARLCVFSHRHEQRFERASDGTWLLNPGAVDGSRRASGRFAEYAILDTDAWRVEFLRQRYDAASTEIKAGMGGYRIGPLTARVYAWRRRAAGYLAATRLALPGSAKGSLST
ncbi:MAG TPA: metallophosphoesterase family protein [Burkholderiales bacterium]|nr:metallophosphoesterase family protein [Burkholderiales bacterium]